MTKLNLQQLLDKAYNGFFLDSIEILVAEESAYKKTDFFKQTKIPLLTLYQQYFVYQQSKYGLSNKIDEFINEIDTERLEELLVEVFEKISKNERLSDMIAKLLESFNLDKLIENSEELQAILDTFKK